MSFFSQLKKGFDDTLDSAALEAEYLKGKKNGYPHPPEVEEHIEIMRGLREEIPTLRSKISELDDANKELAEAEGKAGSDFNEMIGSKMQHPELAQLYRIFGDGKTAISSERFKLEAALNEVREEWRPMETEGLHDIKGKQDKANRIISDHQYFVTKGQTAKAQQKMGEYEIISTELIDLIHILRVKKESEVPGFLLRVAAAEAQFFRAAAQYAEQVEAQIRNHGPISPVPNTIGSNTGGNTYQPSMTPPVNQGPPPPRPQASRPHGSPSARAQYSFTADSPQELSFQTGDILTIISQQGDWWTAELNGKSGLIPANYVQLI